LSIEQRTLLDSVMKVERLKLLNALLENPDRYLSQLAEATHMDRGDVAYHISILQQAGIANPSYKRLREPKQEGNVPGEVVEIYPLNKKKMYEAVDLIKRLLPKTTD